MPNAMNMVFSRDHVGDPAEERPRQAVEDSVDERANATAVTPVDERDRNGVNLPVDRDRLQVGRSLWAAGADDHEHEVHQPEDQLPQNWSVGTAARPHQIGARHHGRHLSRLCEQEEGEG
jgi:hypothetical protein